MGPAGNGLMPSTEEYLQQLFSHQGAYRYLQDYWEKDIDGDFKLIAKNRPIKTKALAHHSIDPQIKVSSVGTHHGPVAALAWRVNLGDCRLTFSGDMSNKREVLAGLAKDSDILVAHNAIPENAWSVARNLHMPPSEIGRIAQQAKVKHLVLSHFMRRTLGREKQTLEQVRKHYQGKVSFAQDMQVFSLN